MLRLSEGRRKVRFLYAEREQLRSMNYLFLLQRYGEKRDFESIFSYSFWENTYS
jgi:hypothetical protein